MLALIFSKASDFTTSSCPGAGMAAVEDDGLNEIRVIQSKVGREEISYYIVPIFICNCVQ